MLLDISLKVFIIVFVNKTILKCLLLMENTKLCKAKPSLSLEAKKWEGFCYPSCDSYQTILSPSKPL